MQMPPLEGSFDINSHSYISTSTYLLKHSCICLLFSKLTMSDLIRDAPLGQLLRLLSGYRVLRYPEELPGFEVPYQYAVHLRTSETIEKKSTSTAPSNTDLGLAASRSSKVIGEDVETELESMGMTTTKSRQYTTPFSMERAKTEEKLALERTQTIPIIPQ